MHITDEELRRDCDELRELFEEIAMLEKERAEASACEDYEGARNALRQIISKCTKRDLLISGLIRELRLRYKDSPKQYFTEHLIRHTDPQDILRVVDFLTKEDF